jgi:hypothetical protein
MCRVASFSSSATTASVEAQRRLAQMSRFVFGQAKEMMQVMWLIGLGGWCERGLVLPWL